MSVAFEFDGKKIPIKLNYYLATKVLPTKFGIHLATMFVDEQELMDTMAAIAIDDEKTVSLLWFFIQEQNLPYEEDEVLKKLDGVLLEKFREDFWAAVMAFSGPLKRPVLTKVWEQVKAGVKEMDFRVQTSTESSSDLNQEEST